MSDHVILVDEEDNVLGTMDKMEVHRKGLLHRAFSILLFDEHGRILLQKRAVNKYHSAGLWSNTCCSHPRPDESMDMAIQRRLFEEMGIDMTPRFLFKFRYRAELDQDLIEHELDHVYSGIFSGKPVINPREVADWKYLHLREIRQEMLEHPETYSSWFRIIVNTLPHHGGSPA